MIVYTSSYNTRSASKVHIDFKRTNYGKFSLQYRGIWNSLPNDLKELKSSNAFKKAHRYNQRKLLFDTLINM